MKYLFSVLLIGSVTIAGAQNWQSVRTAFASGNLATLKVMMDSEVEVCIGDEELYLNPDQAIERLDQFFAGVGKVGFDIAHKGTSKGGNSHYIIGNLSSQSGKYRVYVYASTSGDNPVIQEIRIDKE